MGNCSEGLILKSDCDWHLTFFSNLLLYLKNEDKNLSYKNYLFYLFGKQSDTKRGIFPFSCLLSMLVASRAGPG